MRNLQWALGLVVGALAIAACSDNSPSAAQGEAGGTAGTRGEPTQPGHCEEHADCASFGDCSTNLAELQSRCDSEDLTRYATRCGGTYVESDEGVTASSWLFDAQGTLIGGGFEGERNCSSWGPTNCPPVGNGTPLCGTRCQPVGNPRSLCATGGAGGAGTGGGGAFGGAGGAG